MAAASMENVVVMFHPVKGRAVLDPSQVEEYRAAGYTDRQAPPASATASAPATRSGKSK